jgi:hypothetical protein
MLESDFNIPRWDALGRGRCSRRKYSKALNRLTFRDINATVLIIELCKPLSRSKCDPYRERIYL